MSQMKAWHWSTLPLVLSVAAAVGCSAASDVFAPARAPEPTRLSSATTERGTGTFGIDATFFWACAGEVVHNVFEVTFAYSRVVLPNGEYLYHEVWPNSTGVGTLTGLSTGTVWRRDVQSSQYIERSSGGGLVAYTYKGLFVSETGPTLDVQEVYHLSTSANGSVTVDNYSFTCRVK